MSNENLKLYFRKINLIVLIDDLRLLPILKSFQLIKQNN